MATFYGYNSVEGNKTDEGRTYIAKNMIVQNGLVLQLDAGVTQSYLGSGTTWTDLIGNSINGTLTNGPTFDSANGGNIVFDGSNDFVEFGNINQTKLTTEGTVLYWTRYESGSRTPQVGHIATQYWSMSIRPDRSVNVELSTVGADTPFTLTASELPTNTWGMLGARWNSSGTMDGFWNSVLRGSITQPLPSSYTGTNNFRVGRAGTTYGKGRVGIVLIYNRALTNAEILQNFNCTRSRFGI
jgi:hypothetical protein